MDRPAVTHRVREVRCGRGGAGVAAAARLGGPGGRGRCHGDVRAAAGAAGRSRPPAGRDRLDTPAGTAPPRSRRPRCHAPRRHPVGWRRCPPSAPPPPRSRRRRPPARQHLRAHAPPPGFAAISLHAADPANLRNGARVIECPTCVGGSRVGYIGGPNTLAIRVADVPGRRRADADRHVRDRGDPHAARRRERRPRAHPDAQRRRRLAHPRDRVAARPPARRARAGSGSSTTPDSAPDVNRIELR